MIDCITPARFGVRDIDERVTEGRGSMSDQLTVFYKGAFVIVCKGWHLRKAMQWQSREILYSLSNDILLFYLKHNS